jgi:CRP-like cAMP-binding protein
VREVSKGNFIYNTGEKAKSVYILQEGLVGLVYTDENGKESLLRIFNKGYVFSHRSFLAQEEYHANAIALADCQVAVIAFENVDELVENYPDFHLFLTRLLANELRRAEERLHDLSGRSVAYRITQAIIYLKSRHPNHIWTRKEIGEYCGAKLETVTRVLSQLEKNKLIQKDKRNILINDLDKLIDYSMTL